MGWFIACLIALLSFLAFFCSAIFLVYAHIYGGVWRELYAKLVWLLYSLRYVWIAVIAS